MPLIKLNNRSIKDVTSFPFGVGTLIHIQSQTASNSASISFTTGINSTYKEYQFYFINMDSANNGVQLQFNASTDSGSNYNVTKTSTYFQAYHKEDGSNQSLDYNTTYDIAQGTGFQNITADQINDADSNSCGILTLFNPASTTYVKHFISSSNNMTDGNPPYSHQIFTAGYLNTTSAVNAVRFQFASGNISAGTIAMFGVL